MISVHRRCATALDQRAARPRRTVDCHVVAPRWWPTSTPVATQRAYPTVPRAARAGGLHPTTRAWSAPSPRMEHRGPSLRRSRPRLDRGGRLRAVRPDVRDPDRGRGRDRGCHGGAAVPHRNPHRSASRHPRARRQRRRRPRDRAGDRRRRRGRVVPARRDRGIRHRQRHRRRRPLLRCADARPARRARARRLADPRGPDRRRPALRIPRCHARRRPALPRRGGGEGVHRPHLRPEVQPPAPAPDRRPGVAAAAGLASVADREGVGDLGGRRPGRLLHAGRLPRDHRLRGRPPHDRGARDRPSRAHPRRLARLPRAVRGAGAERPHPRDRARLRRRATGERRALRRHGGRVLVAEDPRRGDLRVPRRRARRGRPPHPWPLPAHRRRRGPRHLGRGL